MTNSILTFGQVELDLRPEQVAIDEIRYWTHWHQMGTVVSRGHSSLTEALTYCRNRERMCDDGDDDGDFWRRWAEIKRRSSGAR